MSDPGNDPTKHHPSYIVRIFNLLNTKFRNYVPSTVQGYLRNIRDRLNSWNAFNRLKASLIVGQQGVAGGLGEITDDTLRTVTATDILIDICDDTAPWQTALAAGNLDGATNHISAARSISFDKQAGNATAYIYRTGLTIDASPFNPSDVLSLGFYLSSVANVTQVFARLGTDSANYSEWQLDVADINAAEWNVWSPTLGSVAAVNGLGCDLSNIQYAVFGVTFAAAGNTLNDILLDHIYIRKIVSTGAQINAEISTEIASADINIHRVGNTDVDTDHGVSTAGTMRVAANIIDNQNGVSADHGVSDAATPRVAANIINNQNGVTGGSGVSDAATVRAASNPIAGQSGVDGGAGNVTGATQRATLAGDDAQFGQVGAAADVDGTVHGQLRSIGEAVEIIDDWDAKHDDTHADDGPQTMLDYNEVPDQVDDTDAVRQQADAYGHAENAEYNRALGSVQVVEQSPPEYDTLSGTARAAAALGAAYDAAPTEIPTGGRKYLLLVIGYQRGAAGGQMQGRLELAATIGGTDYWGQESMDNTPAFVKGGDVTSDTQKWEWDYQETGDGNYHYYTKKFDIMRAPKIRFSARESSGLGVGNCACYFVLSN